MCGFVGYIGHGAWLSRQRLVHMRDTLTHRGPDDAGIWLGQTPRAAVGLAHRRLSIIDTRSVGRQPMTDSSGQVAIVFNGEFYGYLDARRTLETKGHQFRTQTDTEVILALYREYGSDFVHHVDGMFALALWDKSQNRLVLARDRMGIKPLFYSALANGALVFGSEIKALLASKSIDDSIDLQAHHDYLGLNYVPGPQTMISSIKKLRPGHTLIWSPEGLSCKPYWTHPLESLSAPPNPPSFKQAASQVYIDLKRAVERRMVSDVPLGMFLSGGIDSTAVLMAMSQASKQPIQAFTIGFDEATYDESNHARIAAEAFNAQHHVEVVRPDFRTFLEPLVEIMDEPFADSSVIPLWYLCRLARKHVTVALGGDGGDEVFAGYRTHFAWQLAKVWRQLPGLVRQRLVPSLIDRLPVSHGKVSLDLKLRAFVGAASHPAIDAHCYFKQFMTEDARHELGQHNSAIDETVRLFRNSIQSMPDKESLRAVLRSDFSVYLPDDILVKTDRVSMAHGLEARVPFLDVALGKTVAQYPDHYTLRGLTTKAVLKKALYGKVPHSLLRRKKAGFNVPMAQWLSGPMNTLMRQLLAPGMVRRCGLWRTSVVDRIISEHENRHRDHSRTLWALMCFMLFNERFRNGRPA